MADKILFVKSAFDHGNIGVIMRDMSEEEYAELDRRLTDTVPTLGLNGTGFFSRKESQVVFLDENTAKILNAKALAAQKTPSEIVASLLRNDLTAVHAQG